MTNQDTSSPNDPNQDAFIPEDLFERTKIAEKIFKILQNEIEENNNQEYNSNLDSFFPMLVDGNWGTGKTVFCRRLENYINNYCPSKNHKHIQTIYIDAFEDDHTDNPLFVLLTKIIQNIQDKDDGNQADKINIITNSARKVLWPVAKSIAKAGGLGIIEALVTSLVAELPNEDELGNNITKESVKNIGNTIQQRMEKLFQKEESESQSIAALKQALSDYAAKNPLVIFIDELDRCKPAFAMDMLEVIKHVFDIPNVKFILFTFERQLEESIKHRYGQHIDSQRYLDKFIKFRVQLPTQSHYHTKSELNTYKYIQNLAKETLLNKFSEERKNCFNNFIKFMISLHNISLRNAETIMRYFNFYVKTQQVNDLSAGLEILLFYCIILFVIDPNLCIKVYNKKATVREISSFLGIGVQSNDNRLLQNKFESLNIRCMLALITFYPNYDQMQEFLDLTSNPTPLDWNALGKTAEWLEQLHILQHIEERNVLAERIIVNKIEQLISDIAFY